MTPLLPDGATGLNEVLAVEAGGFPSDLPSSTYEMIRRRAEATPHAPAISFFLRVAEHVRPEVFDCATLFARITQAANLFHSLGVGKDDVVAYVLPNLPETHFTIWGSQAAGIVGAINPLLEPPAIAELLNAMGARVLVTLAPFPGTDLWSRVQRVIAEVPSLRHVVLVNLADRVRGPQRIAARVLQKREVLRLHGLGGVRSAVPDRIGVHDFNRLLARQDSRRLTSGRVIDSRDTSSFFCTGGTTGTPKIAVRQHGNEVSNVWSAIAFLGRDLAAGKTIFCGLPLFHVNAVTVTGLLAFHVGMHVILGTPEGYRGQGVLPRFWEIVERHRINFFAGVPTLYSALLQVPIDGRRIDSLEYGLCGAASMPVEVFRTFEARTGIKILEGYGLTEANCITSLNPPHGDRRVGSVGIRIPFQPTKTIVVDELGRYVRDCVTDEPGLIVVSGPHVFSGYKVKEHNEGLWPDLGDGIRWMNTGDLGREDSDHYFWLTGRKKELIIRGGHNIDPASIESPFHSHPAVELAAAIGRPDAHAGELPVVYLQLRAGASASEDELLSFARANIPERAAHPKHIRIVEKMPLTAVGKISKPVLKRLEITDALSVALSRAGAEVSALEVREDKKLGLTIDLVVRSKEAELAAREALGEFSFPIHVELKP